jgi:LmeA-like phospholipid-binding
VTTGKPDIGEQALSKAAEIGISTQLDEAETLEVDVRANPFKLMQGEVESVKISGEGLVMKQDLRAEELTVEVSDVAINPLKAAFGEIELTHPTEASAQVVLTEQDIERAFNSDYLKEKLQNLSVMVDGQPTTVNTNHIEFRIPGEGKIVLTADIQLVETGEAKQVSFTAVPRVDASGQRILLEDVQYGEQQETSPELTAALLADANELLDLRNFNLKTMSLQVQKLDVQPGRLTIHGSAQVQQFPNS